MKQSAIMWVSTWNRPVKLHNRKINPYQNISKKSRRGITFWCIVYTLAARCTGKRQHCVKVTHRDHQITYTRWYTRRRQTKRQASNITYTITGSSVCTHNSHVVSLYYHLCTVYTISCTKAAVTTTTQLRHHSDLRYTKVHNFALRNKKEQLSYSSIKSDPRLTGLNAVIFFYVREIVVFFSWNNNVFVNLTPLKWFRRLLIFYSW